MAPTPPQNDLERTADVLNKFRDSDPEFFVDSYKEGTQLRFVAVVVVVVIVVVIVVVVVVAVVVVVEVCHYLIECEGDSFG